MKRVAVAAALVAILASGCSTFEQQGPRAVASVEAAKGNPVWGSVSFVETKNGVLVRADVRGLRSNGEFGFHVHEKGDCSSPDFMSAGGHFNPAGRPHGHHGKAERHAGDMPNLRADASGTARVTWETDLLSVGSGSADVIGRSVVIHRDPDDYASQPAGNSGPRLSCGVIVAGK